MPNRISTLLISALLGFLLLPVSGEPSELKDLFQQLKSSDPSVQGRAKHDLGEFAEQLRNTDIRTEVLPVLLEALKDQDAKVRLYASVLLGTLTATRETAAPLQEVVPALLEGVHDTDPGVRENLTWTIARLIPHPPPEATTPLLELLHDPVAQVRIAAIQALGRVTPVRADVPAILLQIVTETPSAGLKGYALRALGRMKATDPAILAAVVAALQDKDSFVRQEAANALGEIGPPAVVAVPELKKMIENPQEEELIRHLAGAALSRIQPPPKEPPAVLRQRLHSPDLSTQMTAAAILLQDGHENLETVLPIFVAALKHTDANVRLDAARRLAWAAQFDNEEKLVMWKKAGPVLIEAFSDEDAPVRTAAVMALASVKPHVPEGAMAPLLEGIKDPEPKVAGAATRTLGRIRPVTPVLVDTVFTILREGPLSVRDYAPMALQDLASAEPTLVPQLLAALQNPDPRIRAGVATALAYVRPPVRAAIPVLR